MYGDCCGWILDNPDDVGFVFSGHKLELSVLTNQATSGQVIMSLLKVGRPMATRNTLQRATEEISYAHTESTIWWNKCTAVCQLFFNRFDADASVLDED